MADPVAEVVRNMLFKVVVCVWTMRVFLEAVTALDCDDEASVVAFHD